MLNQNGTYQNAEIQVSWERLIAYVKFPDGFQFAVFHNEDGLIEKREPWGKGEGKEVRKELVEALLRKESEYQAEYQAIRVLMGRFRFDPRIQHSGSSSVTDFVKVGWETLRQSLQLSFKEFTEIKALRLLERAKKERVQMMRKSLLNDRDRSYQYAFRIHEGRTIQLEVIGYDFELMETQTPKQTAESETYQNSVRDTQYQMGTDLADWMTTAQRAAYLAMFALEEDVIESRLEV